MPGPRIHVQDAATAKAALDGQPAPTVTPVDRALEVRFQQRQAQQHLQQQQQQQQSQPQQPFAAGGIASGSRASSACGPLSAVPPAHRMSSMFSGPVSGQLGCEMARPNSSGGSSSVPVVDVMAGAFGGGTGGGGGSGSAPFLAPAVGLGAVGSDWESAMVGSSVLSAGGMGSGAGGGMPGSTYSLPEGRPNRHLWLGNIPHNVDKAELEALFRCVSVCVRVVRVRVRACVCICVHVRVRRSRSALREGRQSRQICMGACIPESGHAWFTRGTRQ